VLEVEVHALQGVAPVARQRIGHVLIHKSVQYAFPGRERCGVA
jgi:hypothetical protein